MHVQTAGQSGGGGEKGGAELVVYCVHDLPNFRSQVLRALAQAASILSHFRVPLRSAGHDAEARSRVPCHW